MSGCSGNQHGHERDFDLSGDKKHSGRSVAKRTFNGTDIWNGAETPPVPLLTLEAQIKRDLRRHLKFLGYAKDEEGLLRPPKMTKECFRQLHNAQRDAKLSAEKKFVTRTWPLLKKHFANGNEVIPDRILPHLELVKAATWQSDLFRLASLTWSVPISQGYGDECAFSCGIDATTGLSDLLALGDPVFNLRVRDKWIGWTLTQRERLLVNVLDAYVLGALPPYNMILGGKLVGSLIRTQEMKALFAKRYGNTRGIISKKKKKAELCLVTVTSALGRSSVYNRLRIGHRCIFSPIGFTSGWGHFHIPDSLFAKMRCYLEQSGDVYADNHRFGDGPNWKLRAVRKALDQVGLDPDLMRHGIAREVFVCRLASNFRKVLTAKSSEPKFHGLKSIAEVSQAAITRWVVPRAERRPEFRLWNRDELQALFEPGFRQTPAVTQEAA